MVSLLGEVEVRFIACLELVVETRLRLVAMRAARAADAAVGRGTNRGAGLSKGGRRVQSNTAQ